jgi:hypothetical protein
VLRLLDPTDKRIPTNCRECRMIGPLDAMLGALTAMSKSSIVNESSSQRHQTVTGWRFGCWREASRTPQEAVFADG